MNSNTNLRKKCNTYCTSSRLMFCIIFINSLSFFVLLHFFPTITILTDNSEFLQDIELPQDIEFNENQPASTPTPFNCTKTNGHNISFTICIYDPKHDVYVSAYFSQNQWWSWHTTFAIWKWLEHSPGAFIDIGANIGSITLPIATAFKSTNTTIYAFESNPTNFNLLKTSVDINKLNNVELVKCAVNKNSTQGFAMVRDAHGNMGMSKTTISDKRIDTDIKVPLCTIDDTLKSLRKNSQRVSIMKLDCEGCEAHALMSADHILTVDKPAITLEVTQRYLIESGISFRELLIFMESKGYQLYDWNKNPIGHRYNLTDPLQSDFDSLNDSITQFDAWFLHKEHMQ